MQINFSEGVYPVMLTPFTEDNKVDYKSLGRIIEWYINAGASGLFAVCQSSEMFYLALEERIEITRYIVEKVNQRIPVLASGHVSDDPAAQAEELKAAAAAGVDAVILLTNRMAAQSDKDTVWIKNTESLILKLPEHIALGLYECPYPYKRLLSVEMTKWCAETGRFHFLKDTSCDLAAIEKKIEVMKGSPLKLYNANTSTLLESLKLGAAGFSGVMANFHPELYVWLCKNYRGENEKNKIIASFLTIASMIERQVYPVNAKYFQQQIGNFKSIYTRVRDMSELNATAKNEVEQLACFTEFIRSQL